MGGSGGGVGGVNGQRGARGSLAPRAAATAAAAAVAATVSPRGRRPKKEQQLQRGENPKKKGKEKRRRGNRTIASSPSSSGSGRAAPPSSAPSAFLGKRDQQQRKSGVVTLADYDMANKRQRRTRPLDVERAMPVIIAGRGDEKEIIQELLTMPGLPQVDSPETVRNVEGFVAFLESAPGETAFLPGPGMVLTDLTITEEEKEAVAAMRAAEVTTPYYKTSLMTSSGRLSFW